MNTYSLVRGGTLDAVNNRSESKSPDDYTPLPTVSRGCDIEMILPSIAHDPLGQVTLPSNQSK